MDNNTNEEISVLLKDAKLDLSYRRAEQMAATLLSYAKETLCYDGAALYIQPNEDDHNVEVIGHDGLSDAMIHAGRLPALRVIASGSPIHVCDTHKAICLLENNRKRFHGHVMWTPVKSDSEVLGCYLIYWPLDRKITEEENLEIELITNMAGIIASHYRLLNTYNQLTSSLVKMHQQVEETSRLAYVGEFTSEIIHKLANSLTVLVGYADILNRVKEGSERDEYIEKLRAAAHCCGQTAKQIVEFTQCNKMKKGRTNLRKVLEKTISAKYTSFSFDNIDVRIRFSEQDLYVLGDEFQLNQVFLNIVNNAHCGLLKVDHRILEVVAFRKDNKAVIEFIDSGLGIPKGEEERVFEPFFATTGPEREGTDLALGASRSVIGEHGGKLWAEGREGRGTAFVIELPLSDCETEAK